MRRFISVLLVVSLFLCGCSDKSAAQPEQEIENQEKMIGVWITFSEINQFAQSEQGFEKSFEEAVKQCREIGINNMFVHVRAFCDAVYESKIFPKFSSLENTDALKIMTEICHTNSIKIHAWINPYRVSTSTSDIKMLPASSPARKFLEDADSENDRCVCFTENGIYLNPAEPQVKKLIIDGIREILDNYRVDGIHFDDYFYPTASDEFDKASYEAYASSTEIPVSLENWRRQNVNSLINASYCAVKQKSPDIEFGISPAADLDRCYNQLFADIEGWLGGKYIDYIMPQLYFGFEYPQQEFCFDNLITKWLDITANKQAKLYCGLANYKIGTDAPADSGEWGKNDDIIARQIALINEKGIDGFVFFSYSSLVSPNEPNKAQLNNIKEELSKTGKQK